jgi:hypothetical protein
VASFIFSLSFRGKYIPGTHKNKAAISDGSQQVKLKIMSGQPGQLVCILDVPAVGQEIS